MTKLGRRPLLRNQVEEELRLLISSGAFSPGDRMPPEVEMAEKFSCNRQTLRFALEELEVEGLIERRRGSGTYITALAGESTASPMVATVLMTTGDVYGERAQLLVSHMQENGLVPTVFDMGEHRSETELREVFERLYRVGCRRLLLQIHSGPLIDYILKEGHRYDQIVWISEGTALQADLPGDLVALDFGYGYLQVLRHLWETGRRSVTLLQHIPRSGFSYHSTDGFRHALSVCGGWDRTDIFEYSRSPIGNGQNANIVAIAKRLSQPDRPDAVVCTYDWEAVMVMRAAEQAGLRIPDDLAVTGCLATPWSEECGITTLSSENEGFVHAAVELLQRRQHPDRRHTIWLRPRLIIGRSTG